MKSEPLISVIVPVYNVEKYLRDCLDSIVNQTYKNLEIILVNDGSKDSSGAICDEYKNKDKRIQVVHKENGGLSSARNVGLDIAKGEYISFLDSDDYIHKEFIKKLYSLCVENNLDIAQCEFYEFKDKVEEVNEVERVNVFTPLEMINNIFLLDGYHNVVVWNKLYKKYLFESMRFPLGKIHEDEFTTYKVFYECKTSIATTNLKYHYYRKSNTSITGVKFNIKRLDALEAFEERKNFFRERGKDEIYAKALVAYSAKLKEMYFFVEEYMEDAERYLDEIKDKVRDVYEEKKICNFGMKKEILKEKLFLNNEKIYKQLLVFKRRLYKNRKV